MHSPAAAMSSPLYGVSEANPPIGIGKFATSQATIFDGRMGIRTPTQRHTIQTLNTSLKELTQAPSPLARAVTTTRTQMATA